MCSLTYVPYNRVNHYSRAVKLFDMIFTSEYKSQFRDVALRALPESIAVMDGERMAGFALLQLRAPPGLPSLIGLELAFLGINPDYQGQGIGSALLRKVKDLNYTYTWLECAYTNYGAEKLYRRNGFETWRVMGTRDEKGYVLGFSRLRHERLSRLRSRGLPQADDTPHPWKEPPQTCNSPQHHSPSHSSRSLLHSSA